MVRESDTPENPDSDSDDDESPPIHHKRSKDYISINMFPVKNLRFFYTLIINLINMMVFVIIHVCV